VVEAYHAEEGRALRFQLEARLKEHGFSCAESRVGFAGEEESWEGHAEPIPQVAVRYHPRHHRLCHVCQQNRQGLCAREVGHTIRSQQQQLIAFERILRIDIFLLSR
jgi:hypothetical protein